MGGFLAAWALAGTPSNAAQPVDGPDDGVEADSDGASPGKMGDPTLQEVCGKVKAFAGTKGKIRGIGLKQEKEEVNAWADEKGFVTFTTPMMGFLKTKDELAVICGHEMSHITAGHIKRSIGTMILGSLLSGTIGEIAGGAVVMKQSRSHEREADERGLWAMWAAGYNPMASVDVWDRMMKQYGASNMPYLSSHPNNKERLKNMKILMVRRCLQDETMPYCDRILSNADYKYAYEHPK